MMGVESIIVTSPPQDIEKIISDQTEQLRADIAKVSEDVKIIKENTNKEIGNG